ncbi:hypothetical protein T492DRAFT_287859 [Pavlovales sp. CCMP2436]|nr:hypothetical protein T492DRAFT_287859 [Pavlovales sp. CCMP2436]
MGFAFPIVKQAHLLRPCVGLHSAREKVKFNFGFEWSLPAPLAQPGGGQAAQPGGAGSQNGQVDPGAVPLFKFGLHSLHSHLGSLSPVRQQTGTGLVSAAPVSVAPVSAAPVSAAPEGESEGESEDSEDEGEDKESEGEGKDEGYSALFGRITDEEDESEETRLETRRIGRGLEQYWQLNFNVLFCR